MQNSLPYNNGRNQCVCKQNLAANIVNRRAQTNLKKIERTTNLPYFVKNKSYIIIQLICSNRWLEQKNHCSLLFCIILLNVGLSWWFTLIYCSFFVWKKVSFMMITNEITSELGANLKMSNNSIIEHTLSWFYVCSFCLQTIFKFGLFFRNN